MTLRYPTRTYLLSDTFGRGGTFHDDDPDVLILTDVRGFPLETVRRTFDIYGREAIASHIVTLAVHAQDELLHAAHLPEYHRAACAATTTGVFVNVAPRTGTDNGPAFHVAEAGNVRVVTTSLEALSGIRDRVTSLARLPNDGSVLYRSGEQFRSSYAPILLAFDHGLSLETIDPSVIPPEGDSWRIGYVDRFGNMVTHCRDPHERWQSIVAKGTTTVRVTIGTVTHEAVLGSDLATIEPGALALYPNGNIDLARKWRAGETADLRIAESAYERFGRPPVGTEVSVDA